jgi:uncharacterized protein (DUF885 family)
MRKMVMMRKLFAILLLPLLAGCSKAKPTFDELVKDFVYTSVALSPISATGVGYHMHNGVPLDELLDDYSPPAMEGQRKFYLSFRELLHKAVEPDKLNAEDRADYGIISDQIELAMLELDTLRSYRHNPTVYVEAIGNALFNPYVLEYAPKEQRYKHLIARLKRIPVFFEHAKSQLQDSPGIWNKVAQEENDGNIGLVDKVLRAGVPREMAAEYAAAAEPALTALREFNTFLVEQLSKKPADWRLGEDKYARKFKLAVGTDATPDEALAAAEAQLKSVRAEMEKLAKGDVKKKLAEIATHHSTRENYFTDARHGLEEARNFVKEKNLLPLPTRDNLKVIETPEFMRGIYSVGGFNQAPALQPELGAFYWLTPIPANWPKERVESKLREYNDYALRILTIHEAMPGHYVQFEYSNSLEPKTRRLLRSIFANGAYVEGWAVYASEAMLDAGYLNNNPDLRLTFMKQQLRMISNTILDIRLQTKGMTEKQAIDLMINGTYQETEEATGKYRRAQLSSCQLPTYFIGWRDWRRLLAQVKEMEGDKFDLSKFHERALKASAIPVPVLARLMTGKPLAAPSK